MLGRKYKFDNKEFTLSKEKRSIAKVLLNILLFFVVTISLSVFYYTIFAFTFSTREQKKLKNENKLYRQLYPQMQEQLHLNADVIRGLQLKDNFIYEDVFHTTASSLDMGNKMVESMDPDTLFTSKLVMNTFRSAEKLMSKAKTVDNNFRAISEALGNKVLDSIPPMYSPIKNLSYAQIGACVGMKINPFLKVKTQHNGLDIIAAQGEPVFATGVGVVEDIKISNKGLGRVIVIRHYNNYITKYAHLGEIKVRKGQNVDPYTIIGTIGMSGNSYAPHLHYEVLHNGQIQNPVNYLFASISPNDYMDILYMAVNTEQSLD